MDPGGGLSSVGADPSEPFRVVQNKTLAGDDFLWRIGAHAITAGASVARIQSTYWTGRIRRRRLYLLYPLRFPPRFGGSVLRRSPPDAGLQRSRSFRQVDFFPYIQDDWKVLPKLTLNLGLRWDFTTNPVVSGAPIEAVVNPLTGGFTV